jgi:hypothetical protein
MPKRDYFPGTLIKLRAFLQLQIDQWAVYGAALGLKPDEVTDLVKSLRAQLDEINKVLQMQADVAKAVEARNLSGSTFEDSYRQTVKRIRLVSGVDPAIFKAFGWDGEEPGKIDLNQAKPTISHIEVLPGQVDLTFVRRQFDGVDAEYSTTGVDGWTKGDFDNRSPYEDKRPVRVLGQPETRYYRFRYRYQGAPVGQYSDVVRAVISE